MKIKIPYQDSDTSTFNCIGIHKSRQFMAFVTGAYPVNKETGIPDFPNPSDVNWQKKQRWYGVIHLFDLEGNHTQTITFLGGTTADGKQVSCNNAFDQLNSIILSMEDPKFCDIFIKPFEYKEKDNYFFGLIYENNEHGESMTLWPNDIYFSPPWDGSYST